MTFLTENAERDFIAMMTVKFEEAIKRSEQMRPLPDLVQQSELMKELKIKRPYLLKLEKYGLKRIQLEENDRTVFYSRKQLNEVMTKYAQ